MTIHTFTIPSYLPPTLNTLLRKHWGFREKAQAECDQLVWAYARQLGVVKAVGRRRVTFTFVSPRPPADPDGRLKLLLDALVHAALLLDDSPAHCELASPGHEKGDRAVRVTLEDV